MALLIQVLLTQPYASNPVTPSIVHGSCLLMYICCMFEGYACCWLKSTVLATSWPYNSIVISHKSVVIACFQVWNMTLSHPSAFMTLCNTNSFLKLRISTESLDPLSILLYSATASEEYTVAGLPVSFPAYQGNAWVPCRQKYVVILGMFAPTKQPKPFYKLINARCQVGQPCAEARALQVRCVFWSHWLVKYKLIGIILLVRLTHDVIHRSGSQCDALLAIAICWLLASACMLICACKIVLSSCSSSRVCLTLRLTVWHCKAIVQVCGFLTETFSALRHIVSKPSSLAFRTTYEPRISKLANCQECYVFSISQTR